MRPYNTLYWDISGVCNGACRFCPSGSKNVLGNTHKSQAGFLSPEDFKEGLVFLKEKGIIDISVTNIGLYSWGEPYLHPKFEEMLDVLYDLGFSYSLSTNASFPKEISKTALLNLLEIKFSMSGFSQLSYDRQHGFDFQTICRNIKTIVASIRLFTPSVSFSLVFHVYRYTPAWEIKEAKEFCDELKIKFEPILAILTGMSMPINIDVDPAIFITEGWKIKANQPENWECPQYDILTLDEYSNVVQCCVCERTVDPNYVLGNIKDIDFENLKELKKQNPVCIPCIKRGVGFLAHNINLPT